MSLNLDSLDEARKVETAEKEHRETLSAEGYLVTPLLESDDEGSLKRDSTTTLYVHFRYKWNWRVISYSSDCWAWVTDAKKGGNLVRVDRLEAHLVHNDCNYGNHSVRVENASRAHAYFRYAGVPFACKSGVTAWACAEKTGYGRWCAPKKSS